MQGVTSASPTSRASLPCGEIAHNVKESLCFPHHRTFTWKELTGNSRRKRGLANSGTHGERSMKAFIADDGLF